MTKLILYIATSQDGFLADSQGGIDWLPQPKTAEDLDIVGYNLLMQRIDIILIGSRSYQQIMTFGEWAWPDKHTYVFTSRCLTSDLPCIEFTNTSPRALLGELKRTSVSKDIWLLGGAKLAQSFAKDSLIDEVILTIIPINLGQGIPLHLPLEGFYLSAENPCMDDIIQKVYLRNELLVH
jgi:dihydrofolate reductase